MKTHKIVYGITTGLIACSLVYSSFLYLTNAAMKHAFQQLGFPGYFRVELALCQLIAFGILVFPVPGSHFKIVTYAGLFLTFASAVVAHASVGDPIGTVMIPVVYMVVLGGVVLFVFTDSSKFQNSRFQDPGSNFEVSHGGK
jgi:hypothetical protein